MEALVDTGSSQTLVRQDKVKQDWWNIRSDIIIRSIHGNEKAYPNADVYVVVNGQFYFLRVGVVKDLPYTVVLGQDLPLLSELVKTRRPSPVGVNNLPITRSKARCSSPEPDLFDELPFPPTPDPPMTRRQRKQEKFRGTVRQSSKVDLPKPFLPDSLDSPVNVAQLQREDPSLQSMFEKVATNSGSDDAWKGEGFELREDVLYHSQGEVECLVLPKTLKQTVLEVGHSVPWAGHLAAQKTYARIAARFYWPSMYTDVTEYCRSCPECQITSDRTPSPAPLQPLPLIETPFERIAMDIVGPFERSKSGNKYILVVCDYVTRYPETFPQKQIKAQYIATCP